ncbi:MAG: cytochrome c5 family protein [Halomonas sp.]|nr:cytochrome c5 family protein [Halomonas sp.]
MSKFMMVLGILVLLAVVIFLLARLVTKVDEGTSAGGENSMRQAAIEERLQPIGTVVSGEKQTGPVVRAPEDIYAQVCAACHDTGAVGAPKVGNKGDWAPRIAKGMNTLVSHALNGFNAMPPRGGDSSLSDEDVKKVVEFMVGKSK